jgi:fatty acid synthase, animal type
VRGKCIEEANLAEGAMAIVNLSWEKAQEICHAAGVTPSSHNGKNCVTISGPKEKVHRLIEQLKSQGITCHEVDCNNIPLHSELMHTQVAPEMKRLLNEIITKPIKRSARWISTTYPKQRWISAAAETTASADYFVNSLCSPVFLAEAVSHIPTNAVVIQMGPSMPLCDILKHELPQSTIFVPLMDSRREEQLVNFWAQLGKFYVEGASMNPLNLLAPVNMLKQLYPVPVVTGFISDLAKYTYLLDIDARVAQFQGQEEKQLRNKMQCSRKGYQSDNLQQQGIESFIALLSQQQWKENNQRQRSINPYSRKEYQSDDYDQDQKYKVLLKYLFKYFLFFWI